MTTSFLFVWRLLITPAPNKETISQRRQWSVAVSVLAPLLTHLAPESQDLATSHTFGKFFQVFVMFYFYAGSYVPAVKFTFQNYHLF